MQGCIVDPLRYEPRRTAHLFSNKEDSSLGTGYVDDLEVVQARLRKCKQRGFPQEERDQGRRSMRRHVEGIELQLQKS